MITILGLGILTLLQGVYDSLYTDVNGCDSLVVLDLTINNSDTTLLTVTNCDSYTWLGDIYTSKWQYMIVLYSQ